MFDRRRLLKVKLKALAAEARIIRHEERRTRGDIRDELHAHRVIVLRQEARATGVAYGFIRGRTYAQIEPGAKSQPDWKKIEGMVKRYGFKELSSDWRPKVQERAA